MTDAEWLSCHDPRPMVALLCERASPRKQRLFACACLRRVWPLLGDARSRQAVEVMERFADGLASEEEREACFFAAGRASEALTRNLFLSAPVQPDGVRLLIAENGGYEAAAAAAAWDVTITSPREASWAQADEPVPVMVSVQAFMAERPLLSEAEKEAPLKEYRPALGQCALLRDVVGPLSRPHPTTLAWRTAGLQALASAAYEQRELPSGALDAASLAVLADAVEEAGCTDQSLLDHLRGAGVHVRGCWAVDVILDRL